MNRPRRASDDKLERLQAFADAVARLQTDDEIKDGMEGDDAVNTIDSLIRWSRRSLSSARPDTTSRDSNFFRLKD